MTKRGSSISVPESWLDQCRHWRQEQGLTAKSAGEQLARAVRRGKPFAVATVHRYLGGSLVTTELTEAFAKVMGVPAPVQIENERHRQWYELGVRIENADDDVFSMELDRLKQLASILEELKALKADEE